MTYTYAVLEITKPAFAEIKAKLEAAGYQHQFNKADDGTIEIDMHGIAVKAEKSTETTSTARRRG